MPCPSPGLEAPHTATLIGKARDAVALQSRARAALGATGHTLLSLDHITPAQDYLKLRGQTELVTGLIAAVSDAAPVQVSGFFPACNVDARAADPVLLVENHPLTPLDPDDPRPFWDRPWCPPELQPLLFDGPRRTYALIDAAKRTELRGGFDMDALDMVARTKCLYTGGAAQDMREVAPYLLDLTPFGEDGARIPAPLRDLFSDQWQGDAVLILRADIDLAAMHKHLRHFLRIRSSQDAETWTFFRFWDPAVARVYFPGIAARPARIDRIFRPAADTPLEIITPDGTDALRLFPRDDQGPAQNARPIVFDAADHALMQQVATQAFHDETAHWLRDAYPDRFDDFDARQMDAVIAHIMAEGARTGCDLKDDYAYLAHMMLTLGGWFAQAAHPGALTDILTDGQGALMTQWDAVKAHLSALSPEAQVTPQEFGAFTATFLKSHAAGVDPAQGHRRGWRGVSSRLQAASKTIMAVPSLNSWQNVQTRVTLLYIF